MSSAYVVVVAITALANVGIAIADYARAEFVLANSAEVGVPRSWLPFLATVKLAGSCRGGNSTNVVSIRATYACAGTSTQAWSSSQSK